MKKKLTIELLNELLKNNPIPEVKQINDNLYEFRAGNFVVQGNKKGMEDIDKEILNKD